MTTTTNQSNPTRRKWLRFLLGYLLFAAAIIFAFQTAPVEIWRFRLPWLLAAVPVMLAMIVLQTLQVRHFLKAHQIDAGWYWPMLFAARKGVLNTFMPARTGTLAMTYLLTRRYPVRWHDYLRFSLLAAAISGAVSLLVFLLLATGVTGFFAGLIPTCAIAWILSTRYTETYWGQTLNLLVTGTGLLFSMLAGFWCVLKGLGFAISHVQTLYFGAVINLLAQVPITPGNMGVREIVLGMLSPYLALPVSVGILAGGVFHLLRTISYGAVIAALDLIKMRRPVLAGNVTACAGDADRD